MNDYIEVRFDITPCDEVATDVMAAILCDDGFESFIPDERGVTAYIKKELFTEEIINRAIDDFPMENAIKPNATCEIKVRLLTSSPDINPRPLIPSAPMQYGPISTPAMRYAVTAGSFKTFASLERRSPASRAMEI